MILRQPGHFMMSRYLHSLHRRPQRDSIIMGSLLWTVAGVRSIAKFHPGVNRMESLLKLAAVQRA